MTIKEVSEKFKISQDTLRYYERIGLIPPVSRTASGIRNYQESDLGWVEHAVCMRSAGVPIEALIEYTTPEVTEEATTTPEAEEEATETPAAEEEVTETPEAEEEATETPAAEEEVTETPAATEAAE